MISIVGVLQSDTYNLLCAAEVQDESFVTSCLMILCEPEVELAVPCNTVVCQGEHGTSWETSVVAGALNDTGLVTIWGISLKLCGLA